MINIITRYSRKDLFLKNCLKSIQKQTYKDYNHIITFEHEKDRQFLIDNTDSRTTTLCKVFPMKKIDGLYKSFYYKQHEIFDNVDEIDAKLWNPEEGELTTPNWEGGRFKFRHFPYNLYLLRAEKKVKDGWVIYLDDDDLLKDENSLEILNNNLKQKDTLYVFNLFKEDENIIYPRPIAIQHSFTIFKEPPALGVGFGSSVFSFHSDYLDYTAWDEWSGSDWKTFQSLWYNIPQKKYIDKTIIIVPNSNQGKID